MTAKEVKQWASRASIYQRDIWGKMQVISIKDGVVTNIPDDEDIPSGAEHAIAIIVLKERQAVTPE